MKKLKDQPTSILINAQQIIQHGSTEMHGFFGHVEKKHKEGKVSTSYYKRLEKSMKDRIVENNIWIDKLDEEIFGRIERDFPGSTSSLIMRRLVRAFEKEQDEYTKDKKPEEKPKGKTLDLNVSKEKKV
jgi:hypothetical protein